MSSLESRSKFPHVANRASGDSKEEGLPMKRLKEEFLEPSRSSEDSCYANYVAVDSSVIKFISFTDFKISCLTGINYMLAARIQFLTASLVNNKICAFVAITYSCLRRPYYLQLNFNFVKCA